MTAKADVGNGRTAEEVQAAIERHNREIAELRAEVKTFGMAKQEVSLKPRLTSG